MAVDAEALAEAADFVANATLAAMPDLSTYFTISGDFDRGEDDVLVDGHVNAADALGGALVGGADDRLGGREEIGDRHCPRRRNSGLKQMRSRGRATCPTPFRSRERRLPVWFTGGTEQREHDDVIGGLKGERLPDGAARVADIGEVAAAVFLAVGVPTERNVTSVLSTAAMAF